MVLCYSSPKKLILSACASDHLWTLSAMLFHTLTPLYIAMHSRGMFVFLMLKSNPNVMALEGQLL